MEIKTKTNKWDLIKLRSCLHNEGNNKVKRQPSEQENSKRNDWQRINLQNIQAAHEAQYQKNKQPNQIRGRRPKTDIYPKKTQMANEHMKRCSRLLIREMQIKTIMRYYLTLVRMTIIKKSTNNKCRRGHGEKETLTLLVVNQIGTTTMANCMEMPKKTSNKTTIQPTNPTTGCISWGNHKRKRHMYLNVHWSIIYNS